MSCICVATLRNKHRQQKQRSRCSFTVRPGCCLACLCICLLIETLSFFEISSKRKQMFKKCLWDLWMCIKPKKCVFNSHKLLYLSAYPPKDFLLSFLCLPLSLLCLCLNLPDGFSISGLDDWFQLWTAGRQAACTLVCSRDCSLTLWWITGPLIHSRDSVSEKWDRLDERERCKVKIEMQREEARVRRK